MSDIPYMNTDREIWREVPDDAYSPSVHVTEGGGVGIIVGGRCIVLPVRGWFDLANRRSLPAAEQAVVEAAMRMSEISPHDGRFDRAHSDVLDACAAIAKLRQGEGA